MNNCLYDILDNINNGIIIINNDYKIIYWNCCVEKMTEISHQTAVNNNIFDILPNLNTNYFKKLIKSVKNNNNKMFFSAALHKNLINNKKINLKISKISSEQQPFVLLELIDVTIQFERS